MSSSPATEPKFTKGKWDLEFSPMRQTAKVYAHSTGGEVSGLIATINLDWPHPEQRAEQEANAYVMFSGPDLYKALEAFVCEAQSWHNYHHGSTTVACDGICTALPAAQQALKLARGEGRDTNV